MKGQVTVETPEYQLGSGGDSGNTALGPSILPLIGLCLLMATGALVARRRQGHASGSSENTKG